MLREVIASRSVSAGPAELAFVLWNAHVGGAETFMIDLARCLQTRGCEVRFVLIGSHGELVDRLCINGLEFEVLGIEPGSFIWRQPKRLAAAVERHGPDGALLPECGFLGFVLRAGGYRRRIVAVEHGAVLMRSRSPVRRGLDFLSRVGGAWADDSEIAVSDFVLDRLRRHPHARDLHRIYNGVDLTAYDCAYPPIKDDPHDFAIGFAGRLVPGKGVDNLIEAVRTAREAVPVHLLVAGDGPARPSLAAQVRRSGLDQVVTFLGTTQDMPGFWHSCQVAAVPSDGLIESFSMSALEAMACGRPVIASHAGGLPEVVLDGVTGTLVQPGDAVALADAIVAYAVRRSDLRRQAAAARDRASTVFNLRDTADAYAQLFAGPEENGAAS